METVSIILNFLLASGLVGTLLFFRAKRRQEVAQADSAEISNTEQVVKIQAEHITRLDGRVEKLEEKVDKLEVIIDRKDSEIDRKQTIIRQAYKCKTPQDECPVLIMRAKIEQRQKPQNHE
ncbi:hypothetical protein [Bacteroides sp.]|uniref:hypothetical protein n=1 Tax=Bacteroides sp. TaxID=29523 RepID=UPI00261847AB|nr:hypothetical protein [Bacteroides sp.]MDD3039512.1 hypothetical protein [Bacteroides sp.]